MSTKRKSGTQAGPDLVDHSGSPKDDGEHVSGSSENQGKYYQFKRKKMLTHELASQARRRHMPELRRIRPLTEEMKEAILNRIHGTPERDHHSEEKGNDFDQRYDDLEGDHQDGFTDGGFDGGFDDVDEARYYENEGFIENVQGDDIGTGSDDPDHIISHSEPDLDSDGDDEYNSPVSGSEPDDHMIYSNSDEMESDFDYDSESDEEIPGTSRIIQIPLMHML